MTKIIKARKVNGVSLGDFFVNDEPTYEDLMTEYNLRWRTSKNPFVWHPSIFRNTIKLYFPDFPRSVLDKVTKKSKLCGGSRYCMDAIYQPFFREVIEEANAERLAKQKKSKKKTVAKTKAD